MQRAWPPPPPVVRVCARPRARRLVRPALCCSLVPLLRPHVQAYGTGDIPFMNEPQAPVEDYLDGKLENDAEVGFMDKRRTEMESAWDTLRF